MFKKKKEERRKERRGRRVYKRQKKEKKEKLICLIRSILCIDKICTNDNIRIERFLSFFPWRYCQTKSLFNQKRKTVFFLLQLMNELP